MVDEKKEIFNLTISSAPALTDYTFNGYDPSGTPVLRKITWQTIKNLFFASVSGYTTIVQADGWTPATGTWTYASATTITVPAGAAALYQVGDKIKLTANSVVLYAYIVTVADTLLTIAGNALTNHTFSSCYYSHASNPVGFPQWFNHTAVFTGFVADPASSLSRFSINGRTLCLIHEEPNAGTSNATGFTVSVPVTSSASNVTVRNVCGLAVDNGSLVNNAIAVIGAGASVVTLYTTGFGNWTNANGKRACFTIFYEI